MDSFWITVGGLGAVAGLVIIAEFYLLSHKRRLFLNRPQLAHTVGFLTLFAFFKLLPVLQPALFSDATVNACFGVGVLAGGADWFAHWWADHQQAAETSETVTAIQRDLES